MEDLEKKEEKFENKLINNAKIKPKKEKEVLIVYNLSSKLPVISLN